MQKEKYLRASLLGLKISFIQYGKLKANMKTLERYYQLIKIPLYYIDKKDPPILLLTTLLIKTVRGAEISIK